MACPEQLIFSFAGIAALSTLICINSSILLSRRSQPLFGKESSLSDTLAKALCAMDSFYGGKDANRTGGWHPEPTFRGTFSILSSCLITMLLCIWTSVHLNIPAHGEKGIFRPQTWRKVKWLFIGLFAPEMVSSLNVRAYKTMQEEFGSDLFHQRSGI